MKLRTVSKVSALAVILALSVVGCRKGLEKTTALPGRGAAQVGPSQPAGPIDTGTGIKVDDGSKSGPVTSTFDPNKVTPLNGTLSTWSPAADQPLKAETVYFEYDKSTIKPSEVPKVERAASVIKGLTGKALRIEGH